MRDVGFLANDDEWDEGGVFADSMVLSRATRKRENDPKVPKQYKNEMGECNNNDGDDTETGHPGRKARSKYKTIDDRMDDLRGCKEIHGNTNVTGSTYESLAKSCANTRGVL